MTQLCPVCGGKVILPKNKHFNPKLYCDADCQIIAQAVRRAFAYCKSKKVVLTWNKILEISKIRYEF
ncbi:MAG: hypothetical protein NTW30_04880 [Candidatus Aenigmarchaeota archaeon]|nr:hypothetical protein [Candidatus Aenigmarchaeota archaeon]